jgi:hypothetical protein
VVSIPRLTETLEANVRCGMGWFLLGLGEY